MSKVQNEKPAEISPHIKDKYQVVGVVPGIVKIHGHGLVDLRTISLEKAEQLVKSERCPYLKPIEKTSKKVS